MWDATDTTAYLSRIDYHGSVNPTLETLRGLQIAHMLAVPFENLDIHLGRPIRLDEAALFEKIIRRRRGGFCYELNGLFAALLKRLGFQVTLLSARVFDGDGKLGPEFDHLTLLVELDERWLADVGFGNSSLSPLRLDEYRPQSDGRLAYRISQQDDTWTVFREAENTQWKADYQFTLQPHELSDFVETCLYQQTSPESSFTQRRVCTIATAEGRITLRGTPDEMRLIVTGNGNKQERLIGGEQAFNALLHEHFGIDL